MRVMRALLLEELTDSLWNNYESQRNRVGDGIILLAFFHLDAVICRSFRAQARDLRCR
jgi:hypothetical protein